MFSLVEHRSRKCVLEVVDLSISGHRPPSEFARLAHQLPLRTTVSGYGTKLGTKVLLFGAPKPCRTCTSFSPGKPPQEAFIERFDGSSASTAPTGIGALPSTASV